MTDRPSERLSRRELLRSAGRAGALAALAAVAAVLAARRGRAGASCTGICPGCPALAACDLPAARRARDTSGSEEPHA